MTRRLSSHLIWGLVLAFSMVSCIKRELRVDAQQPDTAQAVPVEATAPEARLPTGNYGKVEAQDVLGGNGTRALRLSGKTDRVKAKYVKVEGQEFAEAIRAEVREPSENSWDVQLQALTMAPVDVGDVLLATVYFRTEWAPQESGEGESEFVFELARDPWTKSVTTGIRAAREWKKIYVPFVAQGKFKSGEAQIGFRLGYERQAIEIGGLKVENFGKKLALADLPTTRSTYGGSGDNAPWRAAAAARIEKIRKAGLTVTVKDARGKAVPNAKVVVRQLDNDFQFGTCAPASKVLGDPTDQFHQVMSELFTQVTLENDLKWVPLAGDWGAQFTMERASSAVDWLRAHEFGVRGHTLVWPGWQNLPKSLRSSEKQPEELRAAVEQHIREVATAVQGRVTAWDVVNEPYTNRDLLEILGDDVMVDWFKSAHAVDPAAKLYINDFAILSGGSGDSPHRQYYEKVIRMLVDAGAPLDGIGFQGHFGATLTSLADIIALLDRFAKFGKRLTITEFDVDIPDEVLAGQYARDFYTAVFSHPAVDGIVMWGFWDGAHWKNNAPLYRHDWSLKPAGEEIRRLILETWRTNVDGITDGDGRYSTRGFHGHYTITASANGKSAQLNMAVGPEGEAVELTLK